MMSSRIKAEVDLHIDEQGERIAEAMLYPVPRRLYPAVRWLHARTMRPTLYLHRLWVARSKRNLGYGDAMMQEVVQWADALQIDIVLRVKAFDEKGLSDARLHRFYAKHGFEKSKPGIKLRRFVP